MDNTLLSPPPEPSSSAALAWVEKDIRWYRRQANKKMWGYQFVTFSQILISLLITAAAIALGPEHLKLVAGLLGALVAALGTVAQAFGFQQDWVRWRATQLKLKAEQDLFFFRSSPYSQFGDQADAEQKRIALLVERCTTITGQEFGQWSTAVTASKKAPASSANGSV